jgi:CBS domain-containing protein
MHASPEAFLFIQPIKRRVTRASFLAAVHWNTKYKELPVQFELRASSLKTSVILSFFSEIRLQKPIDNWYNVYQSALIDPANDLKELAMKVGDILRKKTARISTIRMNETVAIAAQLMRAGNVSALVVKDVVRTEGNTAVGMFTERDVVRAIAEHGAAGVNMKVSQLISVQQLVSCSSNDTLEEVRHLMNQHHIRHLPVIDDHSLCGVISIRDISTAFDEEATAALAVMA